LMDLINKTVWKSKSLRAIPFLAVFLILIKLPIMDTIGHQFRCVGSVATNFHSFQSNLRTPHAGEHTLPSAVQEMLALLRGRQVDSYTISGKIMKDLLLHERIVESAWPRKMSPESNYKLMFISELVRYSHCREVERRKEVALVFCR